MGRGKWIYSKITNKAIQRQPQYWVAFEFLREEKFNFNDTVICNFN